MHLNLRKICNYILIIIGVYLAISYLFPIFLPFLLGAGLAISAEPLVRFGCGRLKLPRSVSAALGVTLAFAFLTLVFLLLCGFAVRELRTLAGILPNLEQTALTGMQSLSGWLLNLVAGFPGGLGNLLSRQIAAFFSDGAALIERVIGKVLSFATGILGRVPGSALTAVTAIISSFMISARLPQLKSLIHSRLPTEKLRPILNTAKKLKSAIGGWLKAQVKLCSVTYLICAAGLLLLRVPHGIFWALLIALVDAFPILGVGTALIPWSLLSFLQGNRFLAFGLLGLYAACAVTRSVLEPRLVGKQLGLDPLLTLVALYGGYRLWGLAGMLLAPILAVAIAQFTPKKSA